MRVTVVSQPDVHPSIGTRVDGDVQAALQSITTVGGQFIVNDALWYALNRAGAEVTPCVLNQAGFITGGIKRALHSRGWTPERTLDDQTFDAYLEIGTEPLATLGVDEVDFFDFFRDYLLTPSGRAALAEGISKSSILFRLYAELIERATTAAHASFDTSLHKYLKVRAPSTSYRVGLEFETGNIASSFRSLQKLAGLYAHGWIDGGVFITSIDKGSCATRIWPVSNRNGSFQELKQRRYERFVTFPNWQYGFAPDSFSPTAPYLNANGTTYQPTNAGRTATHLFQGSNRVFGIWTHGSKQIMR